MQRAFNEGFQEGSHDGPMNVLQRHHEDRGWLQSDSNEGHHEGAVKVPIKVLRRFPYSFCEGSMNIEVVVFPGALHPCGDLHGNRDGTFMGSPW